MSKRQFVLVSLVYALLLLGCWKDNEVFNPYEVPQVYELKEFFAELKAEALKKRPGHTGQNFYWITEKGSVIQIPANSLVLADGTSCDCAMTLEYLEAYNKSEILAFGVPTIAKGGHLIESGGEFFIQAKTTDGKSLKLKSGKTIKLQVQVQAGGQIDPDMLLFTLGSDSTWVPDTTTQVNGGEWNLRDSLQGWGFGYECFPKSLEWINIDKFVDVPEDQRTPVCVDLPEKYNAKNTAVFMVFKDLNSVVGLSWNEKEGHFCEPYGKVPLGYEVTFVVISRQGEEEYHLATADAKITKDHHQDMVPQKATLEDIKEIIKNL